MMQAQNNENVPKHPHPCMSSRHIVVGLEDDREDQY